MAKPLRRSDKEELWNCLTHGLGCLLSLFGGAVLVPMYAQRDFSILAAVLVFSVSLVLVYATSALSHYFRDEQRLAWFRRLDQAFIYLLIVASYTPFSLRYLHGGWWYAVLGTMWVFAIAGFFSKVCLAHRVESVSIGLYLILGWLPFFSGMPFVGRVPTPAILMILLGGFFYSGGTWFLFNDRREWYYHSIWHVLVIAGSLTHYLAVCWEV